MSVSAAGQGQKPLKTILGLVNVLWWGWSSSLFAVPTREPVLLTSLPTGAESLLTPSMDNGCWCGFNQCKTATISLVSEVFSFSWFNSLPPLILHQAPLFLVRSRSDGVIWVLQMLVTLLRVIVDASFGQHPFSPVVHHHCWSQMNSL